ncbi:M48 family metalloprotease [Nostoc sp. CHAB 5824]|nr:M48 family metalloprotease [Nostoc sp. CHAB 5824]
MNAGRLFSVSIHHGLNPKLALPNSLGKVSRVETLSPETAKIIRQVCQQKNLKTPRLGIINDQNPTAFTYGSLPNSARLVVSQGLFTYLDDDEIAVYAHELGHIVHQEVVSNCLRFFMQLIYKSAVGLYRCTFLSMYLYLENLTSIPFP